MRRLKILRAALAALLTVSLSLPAQAVAEPDPKDLAKQLKELNTSMKLVGRAYDAAAWRLENTDARIGRIDGKMRATQKKLAKYRKALSRRAVSIYRMGEVDFVSFVLSAATFDEMVLRMEYFARIANHDAWVIAQAKELNREYDAQKRELLQERSARAAEVNQVGRRRDKLQTLLASKKSQYDKIKAALEAAQRSEDEAASREGRPARRYLPKGPMGMVFPVAGPHYYSDSWGAARSGGRRHQGTDIMASNGTPTVAVLSGSIRAKSNSLGGLTIWLTADNGWEFYYAHLDRYAKTSGRVAAGEVIAYVGHTGNAGSTNHLHFEIHPNGGGAVNPYPYLKQME